MSAREDLAEVERLIRAKYEGTSLVVEALESVERLRARLVDLEAIEGAAVALMSALAADEEWEHLIVEPRTLDAASALSRTLRRP